MAKRSWPFGVTSWDDTVKLPRKDWVSKMWMGICYLLFYEHVSAAVWFVCEGAVCLDSLGARQCFKDVDGCMLLALFSV